MDVYLCKYTHLRSGAPCPRCMLPGRRQKMVDFVLLTTYHYKAVVGWPQAGDPAHQAVLRHKAAPFAQIRVIQCLEAAILLVLWAAPCWDQGFGAPMPWESRGNRGNLRASSSPFPQEKRPPSAADGHIPIAWLMCTCLHQGCSSWV